MRMRMRGDWVRGDGASGTVGVDSNMKERTPLRIEATDHAGTHVSGWKSLIERHRRVLVLNRPFGVSIMMAGGLYGLQAREARHTGTTSKRTPSRARRLRGAAQRFASTHAQEEDRRGLPLHTPLTSQEGR